MSSEEASSPFYTLYDDQEIPYATLNNALLRLVKILDKPLNAKESFPPVKLVKEHVDFLVSFNTEFIFFYSYSTFIHCR